MRHRGVRGRGAAMVEAVILAPVLVLILISVAHVARSRAVALDTLGEARRCAWSTAMKACGQAPPGCAQMIRPAGGEDDGGLVESVDGAARDLGRQTERAGTFIESLSKVPVLGAAVKVLFGERIRAVATRNVPRPRLYGGGAVTVGGRFVLSCNTKTKTGADVARDVFKSVVSGHLPFF